MANVSVYNMEGKEVGTIELNDAIFGVNVNEHLVHMAAESPGGRKEPATQDRVPSERPSGRAAEWYLHPYREIILSELIKRKKELRLNQYSQAECRAAS